MARHKQQSAGTRAFLLRWEKAGAVGSELCHGHGATTGRDQGAAQLSSGPGHTQDRGEALTGPRLGVWAWELRGMPSRLPAAACVLSSPSHSSKEQMCTPDTLLLSFQTININLHIWMIYATKHFYLHFTSKIPHRAHYYLKLICCGAWVAKWEK